MKNNTLLNILIIDNHDSFTYNLVQLIKYYCNYNYKIVKNTDLDFDIISSFSHILISPGPGLPSETANIIEVIKLFHKTHSILGVCLGHQAIAECFGAKLKRLEKPFHGIASDVNIDLNEKLFNGLKPKISVGRYHSWVIDENTLPDVFNISAFSNDNVIMGISHKQYDVKGIQFHPESIITEMGGKIIRNWLGDRR